MRSFAIRAHPLVFGVSLFLASELMFFAGLFAAYFDLRSGTAVWPPPGVHLNAVEATIGTLLLAASSAAMLTMTRALDRGGARAAYPWLFAGIVTGVAFVALTLYGWSEETFGIGSHAYGTLYFAMTGFHLLHVIAGVGLLCALFFGLRAPAFTADHRAGAEAISYYWHFVFAVWLGLYATLYLVR